MSTPLNIASWNVNSIRARLSHVLAWLGKTKPDVVLLQETKTQDETFPRAPIEDLGYNIALFGQKSYNGVAVFSKLPIEEVRLGLPTLAQEELKAQARYMEVDINGITFASVYVINGQSTDSPKFAHKGQFMAALEKHMQALKKIEIPFLVGGDYNIALDDADVYDPQKYRERVLYSLAERRALRQILNGGVYDVLGTFMPKASPRPYTWWDYRQGSWQNNHGLRIDHLLAAPQIMDKITNVWVDMAPRGEPQPSDHVPVCCVITA